MIYLLFLTLLLGGCSPCPKEKRHIMDIITSRCGVRPYQCVEQESREEVCEVDRVGNDCKYRADEGYLWAECRGVDGVEE